MRDPLRPPIDFCGAIDGEHPHHTPCDGAHESGFAPRVRGFWCLRITPEPSLSGLDSNVIGVRRFGTI
jgi:hypothetical protein